MGVPGSVGGALRMNAGGHGSDIAAVLARCRVFDLDSAATAPTPGPEASGSRLPDVVARAPDRSWSGRSSRCERGDRARAEQTVAEIVRWRRENQPGGSNAGSVFANPDGDSAGRLVEAAGLKGMRMGSAQVSAKHANFIQADEGGSADDVWRLIEHVRAEVAAPDRHRAGPRGPHGGGSRRRTINLYSRSRVVTDEPAERAEPEPARPEGPTAGVGELPSRPDGRPGG